MSHTFISYARENIKIAERIVQALVENDLNTWVDWKNIPKAEDWKEEIFKGIEEADSFLFLISDYSVTSQICNEEIDHALKNGKRIIPILIGNTKEGKVYKDAREITNNFIFQHLKSEINRRNFIFCREDLDEFNKSIEQIQTTIRADYKWLEDHTNLQLKALEWNKRNRKGGLLNGPVLREAQELITLSGQKDPQPTDLQRFFVNESQKAESRNRNWILAIAGIVITALAFLALFANTQRLLAIDNEATAQANLNTAQTAQADAQSQAATAQAANTLAVEQSNIANANDEKSKINRSADLAAQSLITRNINFPLSMLLSVEAFKTYKTDETLGLLLNNVFTPPELLPFQTIINDYIYTLSYSPDGNILAISGNKKISLLDSKTWQFITTFDAQDYVYDLTFSPDSKFLASSSEWEDNIIIWNVENTQIVGRLDSRYTNNPTNLIISPDGKFIAANCNGAINIWEIRTINTTNQFQGPAISVNGNAFSFSPDGNFLVTSQDNSIIIRNAKTGLTIGQPLGEHTIDVESIIFSPDGKTLASTDRNGTTKLWSIDTKKQIGHSIIADSSHYPYQDIAFTQDSKSLLIKNETTELTILDIESEQIIGPPTMLQSNSFTLSPDGQTLAASYDNGIGLWNVGPIFNLTKHPNIKPIMFDTENIVGLAFNPDGTILSLSTWKVDNNFNYKFSIKSLNVNTGEIINNINNQFTGNYNNISYDQQGNILTIRDEGSPSHFFINNVVTGQLVTDINIEDNNFTLSISLSNDLQKLIFGNYDGTITILDVKTGQLIGEPIEVYKDEVLSVALSPSGSILASSSREGGITLTNVSTGKFIGQLQNPYKGNVLSLAFSPDGNILASASEDGTILLWDLDFNSWVYKVCQQAGRNLTYSEWLEYFPNEEYRKTCDQWELKPNIITPTTTP